MRYSLPVFLMLGAAAIVLPAALVRAVPAPSDVRIEPDQVTLRLGEGRQLRAHVTHRKHHAKEEALKWEVDGSGIGTITSTGFYQAPSYGATPARVRLVARAEDDPQIHGEALVFIEPVSISVAPALVQITDTQTHQFEARVEGTGDQRVAWTVDGGADRGTV